MLTADLQDVESFDDSFMDFKDAVLASQSDRQIALCLADRLKVQALLSNKSHTSHCRSCWKHHWMPTMVQGM